MSTATSTYLSAYQPPAYLVKQVDLCVELHPTQTLVTSCLQLQLNPQATQQQPDLVLDGVDLNLLSLSLNGQKLAPEAYQLSPNNLGIAYAIVAQHLVAGQLTLETQVEIAPAHNTYLEGLYLSSGNFCTQCEAEGFRRITYYPDRPDVLASFTVRLEADQASCPVLLANGNRIDQGELPQGRHFAVWQDPHPKPAYLFALVAGQLQVTRDTFTTRSGRQVAIELWVEERNLHKCAYALDRVKAAMRWDEDNYQREYDLDIFMLVAVDDFNMGAMENKGLNIFNSACILAEPKSATDATFNQVESIIAHEYLHNWSGNRVTLRDWFQLSLKEGFTVLRDQEFSADMNSAAVERIQQVSRLRSAQFVEDAGPTAHPVRPESYIEINNFYTLTIYEKGAEVVRMLRELLGQQLFRQATQVYFARFDGQAVTLEDFISCMQEVSGQDLSQFMCWYSQAGTPEVSAQGQYDAEQQTYTLTLSQHTPPTPGQTAKQPLLIPVKTSLLDAQGDSLPLYLQPTPAAKLAGVTETVLRLTQARQSFTFYQVPAEPLPSLLRGFSAPVKLNFTYTPQQLALIMTSDSDDFNRWDAGQSLALLALQQLVEQLAAGKPVIEADLPLVSSLLAAYRHILQQPQTDLGVVAQMVQLPAEAYLAEQYQQVDIDLLHQAHKNLRRYLAQELATDFLRLYQQLNTPEAWSPTGTAVAARSLKNVCLSWLLGAETSQGVDLAQQQLAQADNMTDQLAALTCLVHHPDSNLGQAALASFAQQWQADTLVMDSWFAVQASRPQPGVLAQVQQLESHPAFTLKNPNKVRALLGSFSNNRSNFHALDGSGYRFLAVKVQELNQLNPQLAARLVLPLTRYHKLDKQRQQLMRQELHQLSQIPNLSADLQEILGKSLAIV